MSITKPIPNKDSCYFCGAKMHVGNYEYFLVQKATKPPRTPRRWHNVGVACDPCGESNATRIDPWRIDPLEGRESVKKHYERRPTA